MDAINNKKNNPCIPMKVDKTKIIIFRSQKICPNFSADKTDDFNGFEFLLGWI